MYIIDTKSNDKYFIIKNENNEELFKIAKSCNTLESVKRMVGFMN